MASDRQKDAGYSYGAAGVGAISGKSTADTKTSGGKTDRLGSKAVGKLGQGRPSKNVVDRRSALGRAWSAVETHLTKDRPPSATSLSIGKASLAGMPKAAALDRLAAERRYDERVAERQRYDKAALEYSMTHKGFKTPEIEKAMNAKMDRLSYGRQRPDRLNRGQA